MPELKREEILFFVAITECILIIITLLLSYLWEINVSYYLVINLNSTLAGALGALVLIFFSYIVIFILPRIYKPLKIIKTAYNEISKIVANCDFSAIILIAFLSGTVEELLFRGILQEKFGIIFASILFGLLHIASKKTIITGIYAVLVGFYLGLTYLYTGNLWVPIIIHILNNAVAIPVMKKNYYKEVQSNNSDL